MKISVNISFAIAVALFLSFFPSCSPKGSSYDSEYEDTIAAAEAHIMRLSKTSKNEQKRMQADLLSVLSNEKNSQRKRIKLIHQTFPNASFEVVALRKKIIAQEKKKGKKVKKDIQLYKKLAECYEKGDGIPQNHYAAVSYYYYVAEDGDVDAQYLIANAYFTGDGLAKNITEAINWYTMAAEQGHAESQVALWKIYEEGIGVPQNFSLAAKWMTEAAGKDNYEAQLTLWKWYMAGKGISKNMASAAKWLTKTAEKGDLESQYTLAALYEKGEGVTQDITTAAKWYLKAAEQGHAESQTWTGVQYYTGDVVEKNYEEAVKWFTKAAEQGDLKATAYLGVCYFCGNGVARNYDSAYQELYKIYKFCKETKNEPTQLPEAHYLLGYMREVGLEITKDLHQAYNGYYNAAQSNIIEAQWRLARFYDFGIGCDRDPQQAFLYYQICAQKGILAAKFFLANCYFYGSGVAQDTKKAIELYTEVADQNLPVAQYALGYCYYYGEGVTIDPQKGAEWFRKAATNGDTQAKTELGNYYYYGNQTVQNLPEAVNWYKQAAAEGNAEAQLQLGFCYLNGDGIAQSLADAQVWFKKAADNGLSEANEFIPLCFSETRELENNQPIRGYSADRNADRAQHVKESILLWCNKHVALLTRGNIKVQNDMIEEFKNKINQQYNCEYKNQINAYNALDIIRGPELKKVATKAIDAQDRFKVDFDKVREIALANIRRHYPLYKFGKYVTLSFQKGNRYFNYSGILKPGGLERFMIGQKILRYDDIPLELRARFNPDLNTETIDKEIAAYMESYKNRFYKRRADAIQELFDSLALEQSKKLNNIGMVWVDRKFEWRSPAELVEPQVAAWRDIIAAQKEGKLGIVQMPKPKERLRSTPTADLSHSEEDFWGDWRVNVKKGQKSLSMSITEQRNKAEQLRRRNAVFTKEQMRPTKWSTSDPIFISAFNTL